MAISYKDEAKGKARDGDEAGATSRRTVLRCVRSAGTCLVSIRWRAEARACVVACCNYPDNSMRGHVTFSVLVAKFKLQSGVEESITTYIFATGASIGIDIELFIADGSVSWSSCSAPSTGCTTGADGGCGEGPELASGFYMAVVANTEFKPELASGFYMAVVANTEFMPQLLGNLKAQFLESGEDNGIGIVVLDGEAAVTAAARGSYGVQLRRHFRGSFIFLVGGVADVVCYGGARDPDLLRCLAKFPRQQTVVAHASCMAGPTTATCIACTTPRCSPGSFPASCGSAPGPKYRWPSTTIAWALPPVFSIHLHLCFIFFYAFLVYVLVQFCKRAVTVLHHPQSDVEFLWLLGTDCVAHTLQPLVLKFPAPVRQLLLRRWIDYTAFIWVQCSYIYLRQRHQQHPSVVGMFLLRWLI